MNELQIAKTAGGGDNEQGPAACNRSRGTRPAADSLGARPIASQSSLVNYPREKDTSKTIATKNNNDDDVNR